MGVGYAETQAYLDHFRNHGCDSQIIDNTAGLFNLCFYMSGTIDQLCEELKKKQVNIPDEPDGDEAESTASTSSQPEAGHGERSSPTSQSEHIFIIRGRLNPSPNWKGACLNSPEPCRIC